MLCAGLILSKLNLYLSLQESISNIIYNGSIKFIHLEGISKRIKIQEGKSGCTCKVEQRPRCKKQGTIAFC